MSGLVLDTVIVAWGAAVLTLFAIRHYYFSPACIQLPAHQDRTCCPDSKGNDS